MKNFVGANFDAFIFKYLEKNRRCGNIILSIQMRHLEWFFKHCDLWKAVNTPHTQKMVPMVERIVIYCHLLPATKLDTAYMWYHLAWTPSFALQYTFKIALQVCVLLRKMRKIVRKISNALRIILLLLHLMEPVTIWEEVF